MQWRVETDELCLVSPVSCSLLLSPGCLLPDASPFPFCAEGLGGRQGRCLSVATALGWQREVGGAQGVKPLCELLLGSRAPAQEFLTGTLSASGG